MLPTSGRRELCLVALDRSSPTQDLPTSLPIRRPAASRKQMLRWTIGVPTSTGRAWPAPHPACCQMHWASPPKRAGGFHGSCATRPAGGDESYTRAASGFRGDAFWQICDPGALLQSGDWPYATHLHAMTSARSARLAILSLLLFCFLSAPLRAQARGASRFRIEEATIADLHAGFRSRALTCRALVQRYLARIDSIDQRGPAINALVTLNPAALAIADSLDRRYAK